jgi:hypothetical protein
MNAKLDELFIQARDQVMVEHGGQPDQFSKTTEMQTFGARILNEVLDAVKDDAHAVAAIKQRFNIT